MSQAGGPCILVSPVGNASRRQKPAGTGTYTIRKSETAAMPRLDSSV